MKILTLTLCISLLATASVFGQSKKELKAEVQRLNTEIQELKKPKEVDLSKSTIKASYGIGVLIANNFVNQEFDSLDADALILAIQHVLKDKNPKLNPQEAEGIVQQYMQQAAAAKGAKAQAEATAYLEENKAKEGVQQTQSGLQYKVIKEGSGKKPGPDSEVTVHYTGMLTDGTVFDSSVERGEPVTFNVSQIIPGWTEALQLMKEGSKYMLYIPHNLAYGERGAGGEIPPYATLVFEVELLKVK